MMKLDECVPVINEKNECNAENHRFAFCGADLISGV